VLARAARSHDDGSRARAAGCDDPRPMTREQALHPLVGGFADAAAYDASRPRYGAAAAQTLTARLGLQPGDAVLELGAGTGQLSGALLAAGLDLTAVEPLADSRRLLADAIGAEHVLEGRAEEIPLAESSVRAVFAADAFHWFDERRAMPEIKRVLAPGGGVAILRTAPRLQGDWARELGEVVIARRPEHPAFGARGAAAALEEDPDFGPVSADEVHVDAELDAEQLVALVGTFSWVAVLAPDERAALLEDVRAVLAAHGVERVRDGLLQQIWTARLTD